MKNRFLLLWIFVFTFTFQGCGLFAQKKRGYILIEDVSKASKHNMVLNARHWTMEILVLENTLNDTAKVDLIKVPPKWTGRLYRAECAVDSLYLFYDPYKAQTGRLKIEYASWKY